MKYFYVFIFLSLLLITGCQNEDEGRDSRLVAVEEMLMAILNEDVSTMKKLYVEGSSPDPEEIINGKKAWGIEGLAFEDFKISEAGIHMFKASYNENTEAVAFRVKTMDDGRIMIDFIGHVKPL
ncbi:MULTISPECIES: hypothetical protein [Bacillus]|uniref:DUF3887 domain-containing protein n=2 Tax=Bacillus TaxID=1386 RepID=A0A0M3R955_9BACI|nr:MULTISPECIES: hypothetical protein [Bacillus]ALC80836.1 hypothetical protein AM592_03970 [Bacillus gobiensis]MBP1079761.1 hypothetical protein [Bacillus capparidis]MED1095153.1 hypothetical protein [Bacillus capparidis]